MGSPWSPAAVLLALLVVLPSAAAFPGDPALEVPEPNAGDAGRYRIVDPLPHGSNASGTVGFEVGSPELMSDAYGQDRTVWPVRFAPDPEVEPARETDRGWKAWTTWLAARDAGPIATDREPDGPSGFGFTAGPLGDAGDRGAKASGELRYAHRRAQLSGPACWLVGGLASQTLAGGDEAEIAPCGRSISDAAQANGTGWSARVDEVTELADGSTQATVEAQAASRALEVRLTLVHRSDLPYPTRIHLEATHAAGLADPDTFGFAWERLVGPVDALARGAEPGDHEPGRRGERVDATLVLDRFARGEGRPIQATGQIDWPDRHPGVEQAPLTRWGPQPGGETFSYDRAEAAAAVQGDPSLTEFHAWMEEHPDARAILAAHTVLEDGRREAWSFWFVAPDRTAWGIRSERRGATQDARVDERLEPATITTQAERMNRFPPCPEGCTFSVDPPVDRVPTIRSALTVWQHQASLGSSTSTPSAYVWVFSPWFGEMRIGAGWGPASEGGGLPIPSDGSQPGTNASAILLSPYDGALTARQGVFGSETVEPLSSAAAVTPGQPPDEDRVAWPLGGAGLVLAGLALAVGHLALRSREGNA